MSASTVLGVDPGAKDTGLCVRRGRDAIGHAIVTRQDDDVTYAGLLATPAYLAAVRAQVVEAVERGVDLIAVEGVKKPNPHVNRKNGKSVIDPGPIIAAAVVLGSVTELAVALGIPVEWVPPGQNGSSPLYAYPASLVSDAERRHGLNRVGDGGTLRHARSAYDVAGHAFVLARLRASTPASPQIVLD